MAAEKGNRWWTMRSSHGRDPIFKTSEQLWISATEYFEWVDDNPILEQKIFHAAGNITKDTVSKMRAMTISGLCIFLDISQDTLLNYEKKDDFIGVVTRIKEIIKTQKFEGACADMLNPNIIARDLGLTDKTESKSTVVIDTGENQW